MNDFVAGQATSPTGERKQITALFLDVVGFSEIASTADAEDLQEWLDHLYAQASQIVENLGGEVTEYLGDGIVALFGLTHADELAASRAVSAGLAALAEITSGPGAGSKIQLRAGIASGEVAVRGAQGAAKLPKATGMVTTLAQRVQEHANPGHVLLSQSTQDLLRSTIVTEPIPDLVLKGFDTPQTLYRVLRKQVLGELAGQRHFVGRRAELALLNDSEKPSLIVGQAGMGKSALVRHIAQSAATTTVLFGEGVYTRAIYRPFRRWVSQQAGVPLPSFGDIASTFPDLGNDQHLALALALGLPEGKQLTAEKSNVAIKAMIEDSLWHAIRTTQSGGLLIFEDLHWLDNASLGVLVHILQSPQAAEYKILITSREDTKIGKYLDALDLTIVALNALSETEARAMLDLSSDTTDRHHLDDALVAKAAGVPLFLEQLTKRQSDDSIPASLLDLLAEQIDATGAAKQTLQCAAVIGRQFDYKTLDAIATDPASTKALLHQAETLGVIRQQDDGQWLFSHALLHQAAYESLLRRDRVTYHGQIAKFLQESDPEYVQRNPNVVTEHLSRAQQHVPAIQSYLGASQWAMMQGAFEDAEAHVRAALALCNEAPEGREVGALEIAAHTALGSILMQSLGFMAEPVRSAFEQVGKLAATQDSHPAANGPAFLGGFSHAVISADKASSEKFADLLRETAKTVPAHETDGALQLASLNADVALHFYSGEFDRSAAAFAKLRSLYDISKHGTMIASYGVDTFAAAQMFDIVGRAICGESHLIPELHAETDAHQKRLSIPVMQPYALIWGAVPLFYIGETDKAVARVRQGIDAATDQGAAFWHVTGGAWLHVMDPTQSDSAAGLDGFDQIIKAQEMIGARIGLPYFHAHYAQALMKHGRQDDAYQVSLQAIRENEANGLLCWYAEVLRLHAKTCLQMDKQEEAKQALAQAVSVAQDQKANLWLHRATRDRRDAGLTTT